ncbi:MAG: hypothetical protein ACXV7G_13515 [Halobacteriota archaeon]
MMEGLVLGVTEHVHRLRQVLGTAPTIWVLSVQASDMTTIVAGVAHCHAVSPLL